MRRLALILALLLIAGSAFTQPVAPSRWRQKGDSVVNKSGHVLQIITATDSIYIGAGGLWSTGGDSVLTWAQIDSLTRLYYKINPLGLSVTGATDNYILKYDAGLGRLAWEQDMSSALGAFSYLDSTTSQLADSNANVLFRIRGSDDSTIVTCPGKIRFVFHNLVKIDTLVVDSIATSYISVATLAVLSGLDMSGNEIQNVAWPTSDSSAVTKGFLKKLITGNTETHISVTWQTDSTVDFVVSGVNVSDSTNLGGQWKINGDSLVAYNAAGTDSLVFDIANHAILGGAGPLIVDSIVVTEDGYIRIAGVKINNFDGVGLSINSADSTLNVDTTAIATKQFVRDSSGTGSGSGSGWAQVDDSTYVQLDEAGDTLIYLIDSAGTTIFRPPASADVIFGGPPGIASIDTAMAFATNGGYIDFNGSVLDKALVDSLLGGSGRFGGGASSSSTSYNLMAVTGVVPSGSYLRLLIPADGIANQYDSFVVTHPSVDHHGDTIYLLVSPLANAAYEDPVLYVSVDSGDTWTDITGAAQGVALSTVASQGLNGINSDPNMYYDSAADRRYVFWRQYNAGTYQVGGGDTLYQAASTPRYTRILAIHTDDGGATWSDPDSIMRGRGEWLIDTTTPITYQDTLDARGFTGISPSVFKLAGRWVAYLIMTHTWWDYTGQQEGGQTAVARWSADSVYGEWTFDGYCTLPVRGALSSDQYWHTEFRPMPDGRVMAITLQQTATAYEVYAGISVDDSGMTFALADLPLVDYSLEWPYKVSIDFTSDSTARLYIPQYDGSHQHLYTADIVLPVLASADIASAAVTDGLNRVIHDTYYEFTNEDSVSELGPLVDTSEITTAFKNKIAYREQWAMPILAGGASAPEDSISAYSGRWIGGRFWQVYDTAGNITAGDRDTLYFLWTAPEYDMIIDSFEVYYAATGDSGIVHWQFLGPTTVNYPAGLDSVHQQASVTWGGGTYASPIAASIELTTPIEAIARGCYGFRIITDFRADNNATAFSLFIGYRRQ